MTDFSTDRGKERLLAEQLVHDVGLHVIQPAWLTGERDFCLLARENDQLVVVAVVIPNPHASYDDVLRFDPEDANTIRIAAQAWMEHHAFHFPDIRIDILTLIQTLSDMWLVTYTKAVA
jgi:Holliday junction resolvase-like predicted endonuclease